MVRAGTYGADAAGYDEIAAAIGKPEDCIVVGIEGTCFRYAKSERIAE